MLQRLPLIFWNNYLGLLSESEEEVRELFYKLSETSKYLYDISKSIKLNASFFHNIYIPTNISTNIPTNIPTNISFKIIDTTITRFIEQYDIKLSPNKWTAHIDIDLSEEIECYKIEQLMMILPLFNIGVQFYTSSILIHKILNVIEPTKIIKLSFLDATDIDIEKLSPYLAKMTNLTTFELHYDEKIERINNIGALCIPHLAITQLTSLDISHISLEYKDGLLLAQLLERMTQLRTLKLCKNNLCSSTGMTSIASSLKNLSQLTILDIRDNRLWPRGARILASVLSELTNLKSLNICNNSIGKRGAKYLVSSLSKLTQLVSLDISNNMIKDLGIILLAPAIVKFRNLESLNIGGNWIEDSGATSFAPFIIKLTKLRNFICDWNNISDEGFITLRHSLEALKRLTTLDFSNNNITLPIVVNCCELL